MEDRLAWLTGVPVEAGTLEETGYSRGFKCVAGLDEVGRGPLAGPVMAAAVVFPRGLAHLDIKDSKLLTAKQRENLVPWIEEHAVAWAVGSAGPEEIDRVNILQASLLAMARALQQLKTKPDYLLIDGIHPIPHSVLLHPLPGGPAGKNGGEPSKGVKDIPHQRTVKHGDSLCVSIAAASILAKVARDQVMVEFDRVYPEYGFAGHKGYGSASHLKAIHRHGPSPIHRRSFRPVREALEAEVGHGMARKPFRLVPDR